MPAAPQAVCVFVCGCVQVCRAPPVCVQVNISKRAPLSINVGFMGAAIGRHYDILVPC
jgi:hypothetical protein